MIRVTIYRESGIYRGFACEGHAGFAGSGHDIICAAVSALTVNAANSVERFTGDACQSTSGDGFLELRLTGSVSDKTALLLDSMISGLEDIQRAYGKKYIGLIFKEV